MLGPSPTLSGDGGSGLEEAQQGSPLAAQAVLEAARPAFGLITRTGSARTRARRERRARLRAGAARREEAARQQDGQYIGAQAGPPHPTSSAEEQTKEQDPVATTGALATAAAGQQLLSYQSNRLLRVLAVRAAFEGLPPRQSVVGCSSSPPLMLQALMRETWRFLDEPLIWQVMIDDSRQPPAWLDCDPETQAQLTRLPRLAGGGQRSSPPARFRARSWIYEVDLQRMTQTNLSSHRVRQLRTRDPYLSTGAVAAAAAATAAPKRGADDGRRAAGNTAAAPVWQFQTGHGWADCGLEVQQLLATAEAQKETSVGQQIRGFDYIFDLNALTQTNTDTGRVRNLRRLAPAPPPSAAGTPLASPQ